MLPDSQPQSEPEIALLKSRMILGKTVDDLNLQAVIKPKYFPILAEAGNVYRARKMVNL